MTSTLQTKLKAAFDTKANKSSLSTVATSGSYGDLKNKPFSTVGTTLKVDNEVLNVSDGVALNAPLKSMLDDLDKSTEAESVVQYGGVRYDISQNLTSAQKRQAKENIGIGSYVAAVTDLERIVSFYNGYHGTALNYRDYLDDLSIEDVTSQIDNFSTNYAG